eukprot:4961631-Pyramimonas_sp.AAC.2
MARDNEKKSHCLCQQGCKALLFEAFSNALLYLQTAHLTTFPGGCMHCCYSNGLRCSHSKHPGVAW